MDLSNKKRIHFPNLSTVLMVEKVLRDSPLAINREELKRRLPMKVMHQTLNIVLKYLEERGLILDSRKGILWVFNESPVLRKQILKGREL